MGIHARRERFPSALKGQSENSVAPVAIRKVGVSPPICSDQTKRRQDEWDKQREIRDRQKELDKLVKERESRLSKASGASNPAPVNRNCNDRCFLCAFFDMF